MYSKAMTLTVKTVLLAGLMGLSAHAYAGDNASKSAKEVKPTRVEKELTKYERTGEVKRCISPAYLRGQMVMDDNAIIFVRNGREAYLSTLRNKCHSLNFNEGIVYEVRGASICGGDTFRVLDHSTIPGPICSFGDFEKLNKIKKEDGVKEETPAPDAGQK